MTCDDGDINPDENREIKAFKRKLSKESFERITNMNTEGTDDGFPDCNKQTNHISLVHGKQSNRLNSNDEKPKTKEQSHSAAKKRKRLEIESEFKILQSLIPNIANKQPINEVRI